MAQSPFQRLIAKLQKEYGRPQPPKLKGVLEYVLWENCAYLANDEKRAAAFALLKKTVGTEPRQILNADPEKLVEVGRFGIVPFNSAKKLRYIAEVAHYTFNDDVDACLKKPVKEAKKDLRKFPSIGEPGAEKILLFTGAQRILALDSNALRVLLRVGFGEQHKNYAQQYRSAQAATADQLPAKIADVVAAAQLLRRHGQELCKTTAPLCDHCPVASDCRFARTQRT